MNKRILVSITVVLVLAVASIGFANATPKTLKEANMVYWTSDDSKELPVPGNQVSGFKLTLNGNTDPNFFYYLDVKFVKPILDYGTYGFFLTPPPATDTAFWNYWNAKGVNIGAAPGTWQWVMWRIINGVFPMFGLGSKGDGNYMLIDGLQFLTGGGFNHLRLNGDYPKGTYTFTSSELDVVMTITFR